MGIKKVVASRIIKFNAKRAAEFEIACFAHISTLKDAELAKAMKQKNHAEELFKPKRALIDAEKAILIAEAAAEKAAPVTTEKSKVLK